LVVELVYTRDLKSRGLWLCGFKSRPRHQLQDRHDLSLKTLLRFMTTRLPKDHDALL
jgi:hypothetical protein